MASRQVPIASPTVTEGDLGVNIESFRRHLEAENLSPRTVKSYLEAAGLFSRFLAVRGMPLLVANITLEHVQEFITGQLKRWKPATAANRFRSLQQFFKWLDGEGELTSGNPMAKMRPPRVPEEPPKELTTDEIRALLATCDKGRDFAARRDQAILWVFIETGARVGEVASLRWNPDDEENHDVDLDGGLLRLHGKGDKWRYVPLGPKAKRALDRYLRVRGRHPAAYEHSLWLGGKGAMVDSGIRQMVRRRGRQAGFQTQLRPHVLRHTFVGRWLRKGGEETNLMSLAGWSSRQMVSRYAASSAQERAIVAHKRLSLDDDL